MCEVFVISQAAKGNWQVADSDGATTDGFKNWALAERYARIKAMATAGYIIRLSAKTGEVVSHLKPKQAVPNCLQKRDETPPAYIDLADVHAAEPDAAPEEISIADVVDDIGNHSNETIVDILQSLPTAELVDMYNAAGGRINRKYKGRRDALINAVMSS